MDGANCVQTAFTTGTCWPVAVSSPLDWSMLKTTALSLSWFTADQPAARRIDVEVAGDLPKRLGVAGQRSSRRTPGRCAKIAMSSDGPPEPRFEAYTNLPDGCTTTCADHLRPVQPGGSVDSLWISSKTPISGSQRKRRQFGAQLVDDVREAIARVERDVTRATPRAYWMYGGSFAISLPLLVSRR